MADVFVSYSHEDRNRISDIVAALRQLRIEVWADTNLGAGAEMVSAERDHLRVQGQGAPAIESLSAMLDAEKKRNEASDTELQKARIDLADTGQKLSSAYKERDQLRGQIGTLQHELAQSRSQAVVESKVEPDLIAHAIPEPNGVRLKIAERTRAYPERLNSATRCDKLSGSRYDDDNKSGVFQPDMNLLSSDEIEQAISSCRLASASQKKGAVERHFLTQLGRSLAASAVRKAIEADDVEAHRRMEQAVQAWNQAQLKGSSYAMDLIGAFHYGVFAKEAKKAANFFGQKNISEAAQWWKRSAESGNAVAMVNLAGALLDPDYEGPDKNSESAALRWLHEAKEKRYPKAYINHASNILAGKLDKKTSMTDEERGRRAAEMAEKAFGCLGDKESVEKFFSENPRLQKYRNTNAAC